MRRTVDIIIQPRNLEEIVFIRRKNPPFKDRLALPGGFVDPGEVPHQAAIREAKEETNLDVRLLNAHQPYIFDSAGRDPRGPVTSYLFFGVGEGTLADGSDAYCVHSRSFDEVYALLGKDLFAFDHEEMLQRYFSWRQTI